MSSKPEHVRVFVVTMFASELQPWKDRFGFNETFELEGSEFPLLYERAAGVLLMVAGVGANVAASNVTAVGLDPRFDFSDAYVLVTGIAGGNPAQVSIASVIVGDWVVDSDLAQEIDPRELSNERPHAKSPLFKPRYELPPGPNRGEAVELDAALAQRVVEIGANVELSDPEELAGIRQEYRDWPAGTLRPEVARGGVLAGSTMWHGTLMNEWASEWVTYWTGGKSKFAASSMEDAGVVVALQRLAAAQRLSLRRVIVLRSICNFTLQPNGLSAAQSLEREGASAYSAIAPAVENVFRVGSAVAHFLVAHSFIASKPDT